MNRNETVRLLVLSFCTSFMAALPLAQAETSPQACPVPKSAQDVLSCALDRSPEVQRGQAKTLQGDVLEAQAAQRPNPELNSEGVFGKKLGDTNVDAKVSLAHTFELGGKRGSRIENAQAQREAILAEFQKTRETVALEVVSALYRLRQIKDELESIEEAIETFDRIHKQYSSRPRLTPELQVSFQVFQLAEGDYTLRRAALKQEKRAQETILTLATGLSAEVISKVPPGKKEKWPPLNNKAPDFSGSYLKSAQAELKVAQTELELARSAGWPDFKIGPEFQYLVEGPFNFQSYGFTLTLPLPLYNANGGGKAVALKNQDRAETSLAIRRIETSAEYERLAETYRSAVEALEDSLSRLSVEKKHKNIESLFYRGLVPSTLVIEAHRQIVDFIKSKNEQELKAIQSLWSIYALQGRITEERL